KLPMKEKHVKLIKEGKKWLTLRNPKYSKYPYKKKMICVPDDLTDEIIKGEGYKTEEELLKELRSMRHRKFPKDMLLYDLRHEE
ncbi:MAG: hypothetical protein ACTSR2_02275, partial [Candidatus Hodarchaeales archaeon]